MLAIIRRMTLRQRLVALVGVAIVPPMAALVLVVVDFHQQRDREASQQALRTSEIISLEMKRIVSGTEGVLESLSVAPVVRDLRAECSAYLDAVATRLPQFAGFAVADADGRELCAAQPFNLIDAAGTALTAALHRPDAVVGAYIIPLNSNHAYVPIVLAVATDTNTRLIVTALDLHWLGDRLSERTISRGSVITIADRNGTILARQPSPDAFVGKSITQPLLAAVPTQQPGVLRITSPDGTRRIVGYQPPAFTGAGFFVGAGFSTVETFAPVWASTWRSAAIVGLGALAAGLFAWTVGEQLFRRPIRRILDTIARWRAGDETARTGVTADASELSKLAVAVDEYRDDLLAARAARAGAEARRDLLLREMNHRIKNLIATVQAIANQSFRDRGSEEGLKVFGSRLSAMASAHDLLVGENQESADLEQAIRSALRPFGADGLRHFILDGAALQVRGQAALALSMALHELCTNAAKYGALSVPDGRITVAWGIAPRPEGARFYFTWQESGGPPVVPPSRKGFGTRMVQTVLTGELYASASLEFPPGGVRFSLDADPESVLFCPARDKKRLATTDLFGPLPG